MATTRDQLLQSAEKHVAKGKLDQALKDYLRVLDENPKDIATLNQVGDLYVRMNRPAESIPFFTRIADFYSRDGFFLKAIAIYKKINKIDPARLDVYDRLADLYHKQGLDPGRAQPVPGPRGPLPEDRQDGGGDRRLQEDGRRRSRTTCGSRCGSRISTGRATRSTRPSCSTG